MAERIQSEVVTVAGNLRKRIIVSGDGVYLDVHRVVREGTEEMLWSCTVSLDRAEQMKRVQSEVAKGYVKRGEGVPDAA